MILYLQIDFKTCQRITGGDVETLSTDRLVIGDHILIKPGDVIPIDSKVIKGVSDTNRGILTGETTPVAVSNGDDVYAGEINLSGVIHLEVTGEKEDSLLHRIIALVQQAETSRNRYTALADRAASVYAPVVHLTALAAFCFWLWAGAGVQFAIDTAIAVLIITCPCALGLATPAVITNASSKLFRNGVLLKSATALERLASIDTVVFDKTGTLSTGQFKAKLPAGFSVKDQVCLKALAAMSHHPYAKAIVDALDGAKALSPPLDDVREIPSKGMTAKFTGDGVKLGRPEWVDPDLAIPPDFSGIAFRIGQDKTWLFPMGEELRPGMKTMMTALDDLGYQRALLTGDHAQPAQILAKDLGFDHIKSHMTPEGKTQYLDGLEAQGRQVMMVGDGLNDAAAMSGERLSLAPQSAMDAARASADIILLNGRLDILPDVLKLSKVARLRMLQNFGLAALYNIITIPLAFSGFATPLMAALAMSLSSITVTLNAFRLPTINKGNAPDLFQPQQGRTP